MSHFPTIKGGFSLPDDVCGIGWGSYFNGDLTPGTIPANIETKLTLTTVGGVETEEYLPLGVSGIWDSVNSQFDFSSLEVGDMVDIRVDGDITTTSINQAYDLFLVGAIGSQSEFKVTFDSRSQFPAGQADPSTYSSLFIGSEDMRSFPSEFRLLSDDDASGVLISIYAKVIKRI